MATMTLFIWKFLYIGTISQLLIPVTASSQFNTDFTLSALGDSPTTQQAATNPLNPAPDTLPDDAQWTSQPQQNLDLLTQPQALENDKDAFDPSLIALSPIDTQIADPKSSPTTGSCAAKANLKPGASRLLRRAYGEFKPCCDPVNLGLEGPFSWIWGRNTIEDRFPYCCQGGGIEYAAKRLCVPWEKGHQWCDNPDNWSCCIYGGPIFNGKVHATHCWSIYPPPVKVPEPANQHR